MDDGILALGRIVPIEGGFEGRLERSFAHPAEAVWAMLTQSAALAQWLAPGSIEPRAGGAVRIDFADSGTRIDSTVTAFAPQRLLEYSWSCPGQPQRPLRWELRPEDVGTRLQLSVRLPQGEDPAKACAGFEGHLEMLAAALEGVPIRFPFDLFLAARAGYGAQLKAL